MCSIFLFLMIYILIIYQKPLKINHHISHNILSVIVNNFDYFSIICCKKLLASINMKSTLVLF